MLLSRAVQELMTAPDIAFRRLADDSIRQCNQDSRNK
jgi:hypothetical protein